MLTAYPAPYHLPDHIPEETRGTVLMPWKFGPDKMLRIKGRLIERKHNEQPDDTPICHHLFAAGFNFGPASVLNDCPYDGTLHHLFFGEEMSMAVRLYTAGYDLYAPGQSVCYHLWSRSHRPPPLKDNADEKKKVQRERSMAIVQSQLLGHADAGLGYVRRTEEFAKAIGIDFQKLRILRTDEKAFQLADEGAAEDVHVSECSDSNNGPDGHDCSTDMTVFSLGSSAKGLILDFLGDSW
jgi:[Skp1-protein]-hydroxyproline N-acetylglucosaminyltransferase